MAYGDRLGKEELGEIGKFGGVFCRQITAGGSSLQTPLHLGMA